MPRGAGDGFPVVNCCRFHPISEVGERRQLADTRKQKRKRKRKRKKSERYLLEDGNDGRLDLLQVVQHQQRVGVGGERAARGVADAAALGQPLGHEAEDADAHVDPRVGRQQRRVARAQPVVQRYVRLQTCPCHICSTCYASDSVPVVSISVLASASTSFFVFFFSSKTIDILRRKPNKPTNYQWPDDAA